MYRFPHLPSGDVVKPSGLGVAVGFLLVEVDEYDRVMLASTIVVVYTDSLKISTTVVKTTVLPGPHCSGVYTASGDE